MTGISDALLSGGAAAVRDALVATESKANTLETEVQSARAGEDELVDNINLRPTRDAIGETAQITRPGLSLDAFTGVLTGKPEAVTSLADVAGVSVADNTDLGRSALLAGAKTLAPRVGREILPGCIYQPALSFLRTVDPTDPIGDAVEIGVQFLDASYAGVTGGEQVLDTLDLVTTDAVQMYGPDGLVLPTFSLDAGAADIQIPAGSTAARVFVRTFGSEQTTAVLSLDFVDVTARQTLGVNFESRAALKIEATTSFEIVRQNGASGSGNQLTLPVGSNCNGSAVIARAVHTEVQAANLLGKTVRYFLEISATANALDALKINDVSKVNVSKDQIFARATLGGSDVGLSASKALVAQGVRAEGAARVFLEWEYTFSAADTARVIEQRLTIDGTSAIAGAPVTLEPVALYYLPLSTDGQQIAHAAAFDAAAAGLTPDNTIANQALANAQLAQNDARQALDTLYESIGNVETYGAPSTDILKDYTSSAGGGQFVFANAVAVSGYVRSVSLYAKTSGTVKLVAHTKSGDDFTRVYTSSHSVTGGQINTITDLFIPVSSGVTYLGFDTAGGIITQASSLTFEGGWYSGAQDATSFTDASVSTTSGFQIRFNIDVESSRTIEAISAESAALAAKEAARVPVSQGRNLLNPRTASKQFDAYVSPSNGTIINYPAGPGYAAIGGIPVAPGTTYRIDLAHVLPVWEIFEQGSGMLMAFYDTEEMSTTTFTETFINGTDAITLAADKLSMTFTAPAGAAFASFTVKPIGSYQTDLNDFEELLGSALVTEGEQALDLQSMVLSETRAGVVVEVDSSDYWYVRCAFRPGMDVVYKCRAGHDPSTSTNGVIDFTGAKLIYAITPHDETKTAYEASNVTYRIGGDSSPPFYIGQHTVGGGHGWVGYQVTDTAHGKTNVDVGSRWQDDTSKYYRIARIVDADNIVVLPENTGTATLWTITGSPSGTLTHASDATNTVDIVPSAVAQYQIRPCLKDYQWSAWLDADTEIKNVGVYQGDEFRFIERYALPNLASILTALAARVGTDSEFDFTALSLQTQVEIDTAYMIDFSGVWQVNYEVYAEQEFYSSGFGAMQTGAILENAYDDTRYFVPRTSTLGLGDGALISTLSPGSGTFFVAADWDDPDNPPDRYFQVAERSTNPARGYMMGYSSQLGDSRTDQDSAGYTTTTFKMYPRAFDAGTANPVTAGSVYSVAGFFGCFDPSRNTSFDAVICYPDAGKHSLYAKATAGVDNEFLWVPGMERLIGKPITARAALTGFTVKSGYVGPRGVRVSSAAGGEVELLIG